MSKTRRNLKKKGSQRTSTKNVQQKPIQQPESNNKENQTPAVTFVPAETKPITDNIGSRNETENHLSNLAHKIRDLMVERFLETLDEVIALVLAIVSAAFIYWFTKKVLLFVGMEESSIKYQALTYVILFVEISLVLKFAWNKFRGHS